MKKFYLLGALILIFAIACSKTKIDIKVNCLKDSDCILVDSLAVNDCCSGSGCGEVDYSQDKYEAVNQESYLKVLDALHENCFGTSNQNSGDYKDKVIRKCGPRKGCPVASINSNFWAKCSDGICKKEAK